MGTKFIEMDLMENVMMLLNRKIFKRKSGDAPVTSFARPAKFFVLLFFIFFVFNGTGFAEKVRYVIDGDTFILQNNQRVRMVGINAPEISYRRYGKKRGQPHGQDAKRYLKNLIEKKEVTLKKGGNDTYDRFGRRLAYVYLPDGTFVNRKMVADGYAEAYRKFPFEYKTEFLQLEHEAQLSRKGMWTAKKQNWLEKLLSGE